MIDRAAAGLAARLRYFCRAVVWVNWMNSPSNSNHIGFTCTPPSGRTVARWPYTGRSSRSRYSAGIGLSAMVVTVLSGGGGGGAVAEVDGNRTRQRRGAPLTGFEDRGAHQERVHLHADGSPPYGRPAGRLSSGPGNRTLRRCRSSGGWR